MFFKQTQNPKLRLLLFHLVQRDPDQLGPCPSGRRSLFCQRIDWKQIAHSIYWQNWACYLFLNHSTTFWVMFYILSEFWNDFFTDRWEWYCQASASICKHHVHCPYRLLWVVGKELIWVWGVNTLLSHQDMAWVMPGTGRIEGQLFPKPTDLRFIRDFLSDPGWPTFHPGVFCMMICFLYGRPLLAEFLGLFLRMIFGRTSSLERIDWWMARTS